MRGLFRGARLGDSVQAASAPAADATSAAQPQPQASWAPPVLQYPPVVGYNRGLPPSMEGLAVQGSPVPARETGAPTGMMSIAPPSEPTRKTTFTNEDLEHGRAAAYAGPTAVAAPASAAATMTPAAARPPIAAPAAATAAASDETREWVSRVRDREDDVQKAEAKVRRIQTEVDVLRAQAASATADPEVREKAQKDLADGLDDLEKAERKLADKQRDLSEEKDKARDAGVRFER